jgi:hypothetical protein
VQRRRRARQQRRHRVDATPPLHHLRGVREDWVVERARRGRE